MQITERVLPETTPAVKFVLDLDKAMLKAHLRMLEAKKREANYWRKNLPKKKRKLKRW
ncbi:MAG: hypothetical protein BWY64_03231 [bacterium ADurb.Bin363]|nr:MAG: hypothetical protein BWY64_03231 [bacterium ADurb.Bin363]